MIKLTLTGSNPSPMYVNPLHLVEAYTGSHNTTQIRLMNGNSYVVVETLDVINEQMIAWQHRTHQ